MIDKPTERSAGPVRFATFNLENLFARPKVFNLATWSAGAPILKAFADFNALIEKLTVRSVLGVVGPATLSALSAAVNGT